MYRLIILTLLLSACSNSRFSYIHRDHPIPDSEAAREAMAECGRDDPKAEREIEVRKDWPLAVLFGWAAPMPWYDVVCDKQCMDARTNYTQCMAKRGWVRCEKTSGWPVRWLCDRKPK